MSTIDSVNGGTPEPAAPASKPRRTPVQKAKPAKKAGRAKKPAGKPKTDRANKKSDRDDEARCFGLDAAHAVAWILQLWGAGDSRLDSYAPIYLCEFPATFRAGRFSNRGGPGNSRALPTGGGRQLA